MINFESLEPLQDECLAYQNALHKQHAKLVRRIKRGEKAGKKGEADFEKLRDITNSLAGIHNALNDFRWEISYAQAEFGKFTPVGPIMGTNSP